VAAFVKKLTPFGKKRTGFEKILALQVKKAYVGVISLFFLHI